MTVPDHRIRERRMPADPDGDISLSRVEDMKAVVVYIRLLALQVVIKATSHTGAPGRGPPESGITLG
jgi:hypothetical protein